MTTLKQFLHWHQDLQQTIAQQHFPSLTAEAQYFDSLLHKKSAEYFQQLHELAQDSLHFDEHQKKTVFHSPEAQELQQLLKGSPFYYHSIYKPRGYAGDAEIMDMFYRNRYEGSDPFSRFMHRVGMESQIGQAIRNRKDWMIKAFQRHQPKDVLSLAAGPAEEAQTYQKNQPSTTFLALDHDIQTLRDAKRNAPAVPYGILNAFHLIRGQYNYLLPKATHLDRCIPKQDGKGWRKLMLPIKYQIKKLEAESYDLVYSIGLFDYIKTFNDPQRGATALTSRLFDLVRPGGRLIIGNISPAMPISIRWIMECLCDWNLIYRDRAQLVEFVRAIPPAQIKSVEIDTEPLGINWMMTIEKAK